MPDASHDPSTPGAAPETATAATEPSTGDVVLVHGRTEDQTGLRVLRAREGRVELGEVRPLQHGKPVHGELVQLTPRTETPLLCDVSPVLDEPVPGAPRHGPVQVATRRYRDGWERIFGSVSPAEDALSSSDGGDPRTMN